MTSQPECLSIGSYAARCARGLFCGDGALRVGLITASLMKCHLPETCFNQRNNHCQRSGKLFCLAINSDLIKLRMIALSAT